MEELEKIQAKLLETELGKDKYPQVEDIFGKAIRYINEAQHEATAYLYLRKSTPKKFDEKKLVEALRKIIRYSTLLCYSLSRDLPEFGQVIEVIEENMPEEFIVDPLLSLINVQYITSDLAIHFYLNADAEKEDYGMDVEMLDEGVVEILASVMCVIGVFELTFDSVL